MRRDWMKLLSVRVSWLKLGEGTNHVLYYGCKSQIVRPPKCLVMIRVDVVCSCRRNDEGSLRLRNGFVVVLIRDYHSIPNLGSFLFIQATIFNSCVRLSSKVRRTYARNQ